MTEDNATTRAPRDPDEGFDDGLDELPPNVPPGMLGEPMPNLRAVDGDGSHGLNAGIIDEWTWETTFLFIVGAYVLFFPLAFYVLWRTKKIPRFQKLVFSALMLAGIVAVVNGLVRG